MFSILLRLLSPVFALLPYGNVLDGMIELTNGLDELTVLTLPRRTRLTLASFLLGFGGLAVQFQVRSPRGSTRFAGARPVCRKGCCTVRSQLC